MTYFLDTNIISYVIKGNAAFRSNIVKLLVDGNDVKMPVVAYYEAKRGLLATGATTKLDRFLNFAQNNCIYPKKHFKRLIQNHRNS